MSVYPLGRHGSVIGTPHTGTHTLGNWQSDNAIDIAAPVGTPVYAVADGRIGSNIGSLGAAAGSRFAGLRVQLDGASNSWWYGHLSRLVVHAGQTVKAGELIGYSGSANGVAHLHIGQRVGDPLHSFDVATGNAGTGGSNSLLGNIAGGVLNSTGPVGSAINAAPDAAGAVAGAAGDVASEAAAETAKAMVGFIIDAVGVDGARILLYIALIVGGATLVGVGGSRMFGLHPVEATKKTAAKVAEVAAVAA
jgi:hypothetical protein